MKSPSFRVLLLLAALLALGGLAAVRAGPFLHDGGPALPDETRCLRDVRKVSIEVQTDPPGPQFDKHQAERTLTEALRRRGIEVDMALATPRLVLQYAVRDDEATGARFVTTFLAVHDRVRLYRLEEDFTLPIHTVASQTVAPHDRLDESLATQTVQAVTILAEWIEVATRSARRPE